MMRLTLRPPPASFADTVGKRGENVLALLAGRPLPHALPGRPIEPTRTVAGVQVCKTVADFPYWQDCLDDLHRAYDGICAYYCFYIEPACLPHTDHFVAKSDAGASLAYVWSNYRLACGHANARKRESPDVLDPATIEDGWFRLDLLTLDVRPDPELPAELRDRVEATIRRLELHRGRALEVRRRALDRFRRGLPMEFLLEDNPYVARELIRQGVRSPAQLPELPALVRDAVEPEL